MLKDVYILEIYKKEFEGADKKTISYYRATMVMDNVLYTDFPVDASLGRALESTGGLKNNIAQILDEAGFATTQVIMSVNEDAKLKLKEIKA